MVLDTSALVAILSDEPERTDVVRLVTEAADPVVSAATLLEASIVMQARTGPDGLEDLDRLLQAAGVRCVAVDATQALAARAAWARFGKGRSPAGLNFGDCFSYALAMTLDRPLLFKGDDFAQTDVRRVGRAPS
jgi:ribonuclease VapC